MLVLIYKNNLDHLLIANFRATKKIQFNTNYVQVRTVKHINRGEAIINDT